MPNDGFPTPMHNQDSNIRTCNIRHEEKTMSNEMQVGLNMWNHQFQSNVQVNKKYKPPKTCLHSIKEKASKY